MPLSRADLQVLAATALGALDGDAQATVWWERRVAVDEHVVSEVEQATAELVVVRDGRVGSAATTDLSPDGLARAAAAAVAHAALDPAQDERRLPDPAPAREHDGFDPAVLALSPATIAAELAALAGDELVLDWRAGAARVAIASSRGVDAFEKRSFASAQVQAPGRPVAAATGPSGLDLVALVAAAEAGFAAGRPEPAALGALPVVLGPVAVAQLLEALKPELAGADGLLAARKGSRLAAPNVNLSDSPRSPATLQRSLDAEGVPRTPVPLIQDGVAHRVVADTTCGGSTGHATRPGHADPWPDHLVLVGGGAADLDELCAPVARGLFIPAFDSEWGLDGARRLEGGERTRAVAGLARVDPVAVLASVEALSSAQQLVPTDDDSALTIGATLVPGLRAASGVTIIGQ